MNTDEIRRTLHVLPQFDDVYSIDTLPPRPHGLLVCNLDTAHCPGTHWVAIYVDGNYDEYFIRSSEHRRTRYENTSNDGAEVQTIGFSTIAKFRASSVVFADITTFTIVCLEVTLYRCVNLAEQTQRFQ